MLPVVEIDIGPCINCSLCRRACPTEAINYFSTGKRTHVVDKELCIGCDICVKVCPMDCIDQDMEYKPDPVKLESAKVKARAFAKRQRGVRVARRERAQRAKEKVHA
ncbi:MAG: 4Fe-4S binding protein [Chloroflexi bacterium]|nr:4Fe-4S binding protein [Chloroflexota bacterium]